MVNEKIAEIFNEIGDILEIEGANKFRVIAYRRAAQNVLDLTEDLTLSYLKNPNCVHEISGVGKDLAQKIVEFLETGKIGYHEELLAGFDKGLLEMLRVRGVGPKKVALFYKSLGINSLAGLKEAAESGKIRELAGMGEKSEKEILVALNELVNKPDRMPYDLALKIATEILDYMKGCDGIEKIEYAGSLRRKKETVGDLDILVCSENAAPIFDYFLKYADVMKVLGHGPTKTSVLLKNGIQVDMRVLELKSFGAALNYFTGSKEHNVMLRDLAKKHGWKLNEYGLFDGDEMIAGETEEEIYEKLGLSYIEPEKRI